MARQFFKRLKQLPKTQQFQNFGVLLDTERILQVLTNSQYVERKNQLHLRQEAEETDGVFTDQQNVRSYIRRASEDEKQEESLSGLEEGSQQWRFLDLDEKKILSKRKRRVTKVEECPFDLEQFVVLKKRVKPNEVLESDQKGDLS